MYLLHSENIDKLINDKTVNENMSDDDYAKSETARKIIKKSIKNSEN